MSGKRRVVVLGGGAGALSAAYWLTQGNWKDEFESVTIYQRGWRLGGKGASGRGVNDRIEEHGLHVWFGFYENAFRTLRGCYEQLKRPDTVPIHDIDTGFQPAPALVLTERRPEGWVPWSVRFPAAEGIPGDLTRPASDPLSLPQLLERCLCLLHVQLLAARTGRPGSAGPVADPTESDVRMVPVLDAGDRLIRLQPLVAQPMPTAHTRQRLRHLALTTVEALRGFPLDLVEESLLIAAGIAESLHRDDLDTPDHPHERILDLLERVADSVRRHLRPAYDEGSDFLRRQWYLIDLLIACARGVLADGLLTHGLDEIDDVEFVAWLLRHGAEEESARSVLVTSVVYDLAFAYRKGDPAKPACSAATALRGLARLFLDYKGEIAYKMRAGMGDVVFAPLYQLLRDRGVRFKFFCDVRGLHLSTDGRRIESITIGRQAGLRDPDAEYLPLKHDGSPDELPVWPAEPLWDQLQPVPGAKAADFEHQWASPTVETFELRVDAQGERGFEAVVLGIGVGALGTICRELVERDPDWWDMVTELGTVWTQALQLWLSKSAAELGDSLPGGTTGGFVEPFDTYADMSHLIEQEDWKGQVATIAYFCSVLPTPDQEPGAVDARAAAQADEEVRRNALRFLQHDIAELLPGTSHRYPADFDWGLLVDHRKAGASTGADDGPGPALLRSQFWRANVDPSDRYVQSLPGTSRFRLLPGDSHVDNLVLAGDWTRCGLDAGCVEAAVSSGMLAAHRLCGRPGLDDMSGIGHLVVEPDTVTACAVPESPLPPASEEARV